MYFLPCCSPHCSAPIFLCISDVMELNLSTSNVPLLPFVPFDLLVNRGVVYLHIKAWVCKTDTHVIRKLGQFMLIYETDTAGRLHLYSLLWYIAGERGGVRWTVNCCKNAKEMDLSNPDSKVGHFWVMLYSKWISMHKKSSGRWNEGEPSPVENRPSHLCVGRQTDAPASQNFTSPSSTLFSVKC